MLSRRLVDSPIAYAFAMLIALGAFFATLEIASPLYFLRDDNATYFLPVYVHNYRTLINAGELAHVNFHQYMGVPHLAAGQPATLYPPIYAAVAVAKHFCGDVRCTIDLLAVAHLLIGSVGMFLLARRCKISPLRSALLGIAWATFPFAIVTVRCWVFVSYLAAYLPLNFWLFLRLAESPRRLNRVVALAVLKSAFVTTGYLQYFVLSSLFEGIFLAVRWFAYPEMKARRWQEFLAMAGAAALTCGLTAPLILPAMQAKSLSAERSSPLPLDQVLYNSMTWQGFLRAQALSPRPRAIFEASESIFFIGLPVLASVLWVIGANRNDRLLLAKSCAWVGIAAVVLSTSLYRVMCWSDLMATFRWPFKSFIFAGFYLLLAAGLAWREAKRPIDWGAVVLATTIVCQALLAALPEHQRPFEDYRISRRLEALRNSLAYRCADGLDRVASFAPEPAVPGKNKTPKSVEPEAMGFNYATLAGRYQFAGYDPIAPTRQREAALGLNYIAQIEQPITAELIEHLGSWSVRWLVVPSGSPNARALTGFDELELRGDDGRVAVFENLRCRPLAAMRAPNSCDLLSTPISISGNSLQLDVGGRRGIATVNCVYHPSYVLEADGERVEGLHETNDHRMQFRVPGGARRVTIRYSDDWFARGVMLAMATSGAILLMLIWSNYSSLAGTRSRLGERSRADSCSSAESSSKMASSSESSGPAA